MQEGLDGEMAGDLAGGGATHAIADDEDAALRAGAGSVLVGAADAAAVREQGEGVGVLRGGAGGAAWACGIAASAVAASVGRGLGRFNVAVFGISPPGIVRFPAVATILPCANRSQSPIRSG